MKTMNDVTLYDLMAEDLDVYVCLNKQFGFNLSIDDENSEPLLADDGVHPFAMDSFADFCRRFVASYDNAKRQEAA